jgi:Putative Ig domain
LPVTHAIAEPVILAIMTMFVAGHRSSQAEGAAPLAISGEPRVAVGTDVFYAFTPSVARSGARPLRFSIRNKPAWASFGRRHGTLYGVPHAAQAGTYSNIVISVSDGHTTVRLPAFSIEVGPALACAATSPR